MTKEYSKDYHIHLRVDKEEKEKLSRIAREQGYSQLSPFIRWLLKKYMKEVKK